MKFFYITFHVIFLLFFAAQQKGYAFDPGQMPSQQYSGSGTQKSNTLPTSVTPQMMQGVTVKENLGNYLDLNATFIDQNGQTKTIAQILNGKPLILTLNYYTCTTLCSIQLMSLAQSIHAMGWPIGNDFNMATLSFDPSDTTQSAYKKQQEYLTLAQQPRGQWDFFIDNKGENIKKIADALGFYYKYDPASKEFSHTAAIFFISPEGKISRYLYGVQYKPNDIKFAIMDASANKIGTTTERILLTCYHYNPTNGRYDAFAVNFLRIGALITMLVIGGILAYFFRADKKRRLRIGL